MTGKIGADYQGMYTIANNLAQKAENYAINIKEIYNIIEDLQNNWKGKDNISFIEKVNSYKEDLLDLGRALQNYAVFLNEASNSIGQLQDDITSGVGRL